MSVLETSSCFIPCRSMGVIMNFSNKAGIYKFTNLINNKVYIGKTFNLKERISIHRSASTNLLLHKSIRKYGRDNFSIEVLYEFEVRPDNTELLALETAYIEYFQSLSSQHGYNICLFATDRTGIKNSESTKEKIRHWKLNCGPRDAAIFKKISISNKGREPSHMDKNKYSFWNKKLKEGFIGTRRDFSKKYNLNNSEKVRLLRLIKGNNNRFKDWILFN
jgi:group I intron endonuclease